MYADCRRRPVRGSGREEIDARDCLVTPGFVDIHTHYDAQITWEPTFVSSSMHGVTTVVMGNCGVGVAPVRPEHRDLLMRVMEGVEDIPAAVMAAGIPWDWTTFEDYLDWLGEQRADIDFAAQVPHTPVRIEVMGERAVALEPADPADIAAMAEIVRRGIAAGALGFTTSRSVLHRMKDGGMTPTFAAGETELLAIPPALRAAGSGVLQMIDDFDDANDGPSPTFDIWRRIARTAGRPLSYNVTQREGTPDRWRHLLRIRPGAAAEGLDVRGQVERPRDRPAVRTGSLVPPVQRVPELSWSSPHCRLPSGSSNCASRVRSASWRNGRARAEPAPHHATPQSPEDVPAG